MTAERIPAGLPCPRCGAAVPPDATYCPNCGYALAQPPPYPSPPYVGTRNTSPPVIGGVLILISGLLHVMTGALVLLFGSVLAELAGALGLGGLVALFGAIGIMFGAVAIIGGAFAMVRRMWWLAVVGGVLAVLAIGPSFLGSLLALVGLILVAVSRDEFS